MEFGPFGQDDIPPTAGKATKCRMLYNSLEFVCKRGIEAFNLLFNLFMFYPSTLLHFNPSIFTPWPSEARYFQSTPHDAAPSPGDEWKPTQTTCAAYRVPSPRGGRRNQYAGFLGNFGKAHHKGITIMGTMSPAFFTTPINSYKPLKTP